MLSIISLFSEHAEGLLGSSAERHWLIACQANKCRRQYSTRSMTTQQHATVLGAFARGTMLDFERAVPRPGLGHSRIAVNI